MTVRSFADDLITFPALYCRRYVLPAACSVYLCMYIHTVRGAAMCCVDVDTQFDAALHLRASTCDVTRHSSLVTSKYLPFVALDCWPGRESVRSERRQPVRHRRPALSNSQAGVKVSCFSRHGR